MKLSKWFGILLVVAVVLYLIAMLVAPPLRYETRVEIDRPVDVSWHVFTDESRMGEWLDGFKSVETLSGDPLTPGSRHRLVLQEDGKEIAFDEEVLLVEPNETYSFRLTHPMMESEVVVRFEDLGERSAIVTENRVDTAAWMRPLMLPARSTFERRQLAGYEKLKRLIEAEPETEPMPDPVDDPADDEPLES